MKHEKIERLAKMGFTQKVERIRAGQCPECGVAVQREHLRDDLSRREFDISGLCQSDQDAVFV